MSKNYFTTIALICFCVFGSFAQDARQQPNPAIDGLSFYPNPVSTGKIYITSKSSLEKDILIFDVLGKKVMQTTLTARELNISNLSPGVYIIKIKEGEATATRKLIVN
jgi:hypothetical protein